MAQSHAKRPPPAAHDYFSMADAAETGPSSSPCSAAHPLLLRPPLRTACTQNKFKNNDWSAIVTLFDELNKNLDKVRSSSCQLRPPACCARLRAARGCLLRPAAAGLGDLLPAAFGCAACCVARAVSLLLRDAAVGAGLTPAACHPHSLAPIATLSQPAGPEDGPRRAQVLRAHPGRARGLPHGVARQQGAEEEDVGDQLQGAQHDAPAPQEAQRAGACAAAGTYLPGCCAAAPAPTCCLGQTLRRLRLKTHCIPWNPNNNTQFADSLAKYREDPSAFGSEAEAAEEEEESSSSSESGSGEEDEGEERVDKRIGED